MEPSAKQRSKNVHQTPAITTELVSIRHRDTNAFVRKSLLARTVKTLETSACHDRVKMEVHASLIT